jgi:hypothetical protein
MMILLGCVLHARAISGKLQGTHHQVETDSELRVWIPISPNQTMLVLMPANANDVMLQVALAFTGAGCQVRRCY